MVRGEGSDTCHIHYPKLTPILIKSVKRLITILKTAILSHYRFLKLRIYSKLMSITTVVISGKPAIICIRVSFKTAI